MIARSYIAENLKALSRGFDNSKSQRDSLFYSKLAILELCGWIEESMDDIVNRCATRQLRDPANITHCRTDIVKKINGFDYDYHFRFMLGRLIGLINVEKVEKKIDPVKFHNMKAALGALKLERNAEAHTHLRGTTRIINAPSLTINRFTSVSEGLLEFERVIRSRRW